MTIETIDKNLLKGFKQCERELDVLWGRGLLRLGPALRAALLSERILIVADTQGDTIAPETVRKIVSQGRSYVIERENDWVEGRA